PLRRTQRPAPRARVLSRARARPHARRAAAARAHDRRYCVRRRGVRARRRLRDSALVVAALRRAGLVPRPARADLPRALAPAGELRLQHRQRTPAAAARLDVPLTARELVPVRRRPAPARRVAPDRPTW